MKGSGEEGKDTVIRSDSTLLVGTKGNTSSTLTPLLVPPLHPGQPRPPRRSRKSELVARKFTFFLYLTEYFQIFSHLLCLRFV